MKARHEFESENDYVSYLRTYFAAMAMQGILASNTAGMSSSRIDIFAFAEQGVKAADALIKALNETENK